MHILKHGTTLILPKNEIAKSNYDELSCTVTEETDELTKIQNTASIELTDGIDWSNELVEAQSAILKEEKSFDKHHIGLFDATLATTIKILQFQRKASEKTNLNTDNKIVSFTYNKVIAEELLKQRKNKSPKKNENPVLAITKLLLKDAPCKNTNTTYVRDGKYAECVLLAEKEGWDENKLVAEYKRHGGRDGMALHAIRLRKIEKNEMRSNCELDEPSLEIFLELLAPQSHVGSFQIEANTCTLFALIKPSENGENFVVPLPEICMSSIIDAIFLILKKNKKTSNTHKNASDSIAATLAKN